MAILNAVGWRGLFQQAAMTRNLAKPTPTLSVVDAVTLIVGIVVGAGIFRTPSLVAANMGTVPAFLAAWVVGGFISLIGALCYAELATAYPHAGGDYYYFTRAFGRPIAFLFAWARMTVIQTGSIAVLGFIFGDYLAELLPLGAGAAPIYAGVAIVALTLTNAAGVQQGTKTQSVLTGAKVLGMLLVILAGLSLTNAPATAAPTQAPTQASTNIGLGMLFVLFAYGGWNEAAFLGAELRNVQRNMVRALLFSLAIITGIYLLINLAYFKGLGLATMGQSSVVAADLMRQVFGEAGAKFISLLIAISVLAALNGTIFTGARTNYAVGQDFSNFRWLGRWQQGSNTPTIALMVQGAIALVLVLFGSFTRDGFETLVRYVSPVFWFFFLLTGISLFVLRSRDPQTPRPFRVPLYPLSPLLFCLTCGYLLYSSLVYENTGAWGGVAVLATGAVVYLLAGTPRPPQAELGTNSETNESESPRSRT